jgi:hypothetical protein
MTIFLSEDNVTNLNHPAIVAGMLTAAELAEARRFNAGNVLYLRRASACTGNCRQGRDCTCTPDTVPTDYSVPGWLDSCAPEGGKHADPVPTMSSETGARIGAVLLLISAVSVIGVISAAVLARWPLV